MMDVAVYTPLNYIDLLPFLKTIIFIALAVAAYRLTVMKLVSRVKFLEVEISAVRASVGVAENNWDERDAFARSQSDSAIEMVYAYVEKAAERRNLSEEKRVVELRKAIDESTAKTESTIKILYEHIARVEEKCGVEVREQIRAAVRLLEDKLKPKTVKKPLTVSQVCGLAQRHLRDPVSDHDRVHNTLLSSYNDPRRVCATTKVLEELHDGGIDLKDEHKGGHIVEITDKCFHACKEHYINKIIYLLDVVKVDPAVRYRDMHESFIENYKRSRQHRISTTPELLLKLEDALKAIKIM